MMTDTMTQSNQTKMNLSKEKNTDDATIYSTIDYDQFKTVVGNRDVFGPHLRNLITEIEKNDMLAQNPGIVNEDMRVIDGQHRLLAAKALGKPFYYSIKKGATLEEVQMLNKNNRSWTTYDYLNSYIAQGKKEYVQLAEFADEYRISVPIAMRILGGRVDDSHILKAFRSGHFAIANLEQAHNLASLISEVRKRSPDGAWAHRSCLKALAKLQVSMNPRLFTDALERYNQIVTRRVSVKDYLRQFENIINAGREGKEIHLD